MQITPLLRKLRHKYIWKRVFLERMTEPLHLNLVSLFVAMFGSFRTKVAFDLVIRQQHAYGILAAADIAKAQGNTTVALLEFGVANGAGLLNICHVAKLVTAATGINFLIFGFDTGKGMPPPRSYKDHPELYQEGDFPMDNVALEARLPPNAKLLLGELTNTVPQFLATTDSTVPIGFVSIDVDYHSSTVDALRVLDGTPERYLPRVPIYLDDVHFDSHNSWCGELLAVNEFNQAHEFRKIESHAFFRGSRIMKNASWIDHMVTLHVLDHPVRSMFKRSRDTISLSNPYL